MIFKGSSQLKQFHVSVIILVESIYSLSKLSQHLKSRLRKVKKKKKVLFKTSLVIRFKIFFLKKLWQALYIVLYCEFFKPWGKKILGWGCSLMSGFFLYSWKKIPISVLQYFLWYANLVIRLVSQNIYCGEKNETKHILIANVCTGLHLFEHAGI